MELTKESTSELFIEINKELIEKECSNEALEVLFELKQRFKEKEDEIQQLTYSKRKKPTKKISVSIKKQIYRRLTKEGVDEFVEFCLKK